MGAEGPRRLPLHVAPAKLTTLPPGASRGTVTQHGTQPELSVRIPTRAPASFVSASPSESLRRRLLSTVRDQAVRVHPSPSESIRVYLRLSESVRAYPRLSTSIRVYPSLSASIRVYRGPSRRLARTCAAMMALAIADVCHPPPPTPTARRDLSCGAGQGRAARIALE